MSRRGVNEAVALCSDMGTRRALKPLRELATRMYKG